MTIRSGDTSMTSLNVSKYVLHSSWNRRIALNLRPRNAFCIKRFISSDFVKISPAVLDCVERGKPVVALESTILTHGLPQGVNYETATRLEEICKRKGVTPATVGVIDGHLKVGLSSEEISYLCSGENKLKKISRRDLPIAFANNQSGGTTVSSTLIGCRFASIPIFATGGLGGVHRGVSETWDVSADLEELAITPVSVVCSGVKSILDVAKTLEYLETKGVSVVSYKTTHFPTFFSNSKQILSPNVAHSVEELSRILHFTRKSGLNSGLVIANPLSDEISVDGELVEMEIQKAIKLANELRISGNEFTPFVLDQIRKLSGGKSLAANLALVEGNVKLACKLAVEYSRYKARLKRKFENNSRDKPDIGHSVQVEQLPLVIGGINVDITIKPKSEPTPASVPSEISLSIGGVGRNIAQALHYLKAEPNFLSAVGNDSLGNLVANNFSLNKENLITSNQHPTSIYSLVLHPKTSELLYGFAQSKIHNEISPEVIKDKEELITESSVVIHDGNIAVETSRRIFELCQRHEKCLLFEPTDYVGCIKFAQILGEFPKVCTLVTPNLKEMFTLNKSLEGGKTEFLMESLKKEACVFDNDASSENCLKMVSEHSRRLLDVTKITIVSMGKLGVIVGSRNFTNEEVNNMEKYSDQKIDLDDSKFFHFQTSVVDNAMSCSGAGDSFVAGFVASYFQRKRTIAESVKFGLKCANTSLETVEAVNTKLNEIH